MQDFPRRRMTLATNGPPQVHSDKELTEALFDGAWSLDSLHEIPRWNRPFQERLS